MESIDAKARAILETALHGRCPAVQLELRRVDRPGQRQVVVGFAPWQRPDFTKEEAAAAARAVLQLRARGFLTLESGARLWIAGDFDAYYRSALYEALCRETLARARTNPEDAAVYPYLHRAYLRLTPWGRGVLEGAGQRFLQPSPKA